MQLPILTRAATTCLLCFLLLSLSHTGRSQTTTEKLTVEKIMQDPKWIGSSPSEPFWSQDGKYLFFKWNPDHAADDSVYYITREDQHPQKAAYSLLQTSTSADNVSYNTAHTASTFTREGDIFLMDAKTGKEKRVTHTVDPETNPVFSFHDSRIVYSRGGNLFSWDIATGETAQLTNFQHTAPPAEEKPS